MIDRQEQLAVQSGGIDSAAIQRPTHVDRGHLVKSRCLIPDLGVARANAVKDIVKRAFPANEQISIRVHVESSQISRERNSDGSLPGHSAIGGPAELTTATAGRSVPGLVLETVSGAVRLINGKPLLIAATCESVSLQFCPGLAAVCRTIYVVTERLKKAKVKEGSGLVRVGDRIAAKNSRFQNPGKGPVDASVRSIPPAALPEVRRYIVKLSPTNRHPAAIGRVNRDRTFVSGVTDDVIAICVDVHLVADERTMWRDHSWRGLQPVDVRSRRVVVFFQWLFGVRVPRRRQLA